MLVISAVVIPFLPTTIFFFFCVVLPLASDLMFKSMLNYLGSLVLEHLTSFAEPTASIIYSHFLSRKFFVHLCLSWQFRNMSVAFCSLRHTGQVPPSTPHRQPFQFPSPSETKPTHSNSSHCTTYSSLHPSTQFRSYQPSSFRPQC